MPSSLSWLVHHCTEMRHQMSDSANEKKRAPRTQSAVIVPIIATLITAITSVIVTYLTVQGNENAVRLETQSTFAAFQSQVSQSTSVAQISVVTPTPNINILSLENVNGRLFA